MSEILPIALTPKKTLLIGAGAVAAQKYKVLKEANFDITIVAKEKKHSVFSDVDVILASLQTDTENIESNLNHIRLQEKVCANLDSKISQNIESNLQDSNNITSKSIESNNKISKKLENIESKTTDSIQIIDCHANSSDLTRNNIDSKNPNFNTKNLQIIESNFLQNFDLVIDATGDKNLGVFLHKNRKKLGFLLNVVDVPELCDFYFGAIVRSENVAIMVSTNGASPILAQKIRDKIARILPKSIGKFSTYLKEMRTKILSNKDEENKKLSPTERENIAKACEQNLGKVFIIGAGPGDFNSLTLKALEALQLIDVALIDNLVSAQIWEFLQQNGVECVSVGKQKGKKSFKQDAINRLMLDYTLQGKCVGRIKGGDPVIFGRVWEEASFLKKHNVDVECVSGVSSSLCGSLSSGIVPTLRGVSSGVLIVSAHLRENIFHTQWLLWLKNSPYTLIVMMAYSFADKIVAEARLREIDLNIPAAFVSKVDTPQQKSVIGTLGELESMAKVCDKPAILIIGKAVLKAHEMPYIGERIVIESSEEKNLESSILTLGA
ncbi:uroporphyrinogen-III C-methyltransferase [Helicobacter saguini]|uniref:Uroporphyrinogen-III C-methyltransferase n=1 Tax=Helicobacter saguini TaxID=1548018 RepID=A0A347VJV6_9HELI|nr:uroporphyrinogen-III C-methyltransferase [Helicobacter saguini]MWV60897.1 uroporphyrinogen-III C-methyltransferase [Helicobacter saguini]MWV68435.1 uroporphyrinogen-III C-methyltransferase [Helicobacter saguini]MWV70101.1 uroporphyrinogen-III C-methyltransferase [Helicobacter saguini]MWV72004.1 uroporphyrinogen-III C-methyltransferase [Helicobacter saguini]TLD93769.1 uroporphyrinogen-III C-methyltransferase [Helicobacter saguini]